MLINLEKGGDTVSERVDKGGGVIINAIFMEKKNSATRREQPPTD